MAPRIVLYSWLTQKFFSFLVFSYKEIMDLRNIPALQYRMRSLRLKAFGMIKIKWQQSKKNNWFVAKRNFIKIFN